MWYGGLICVVLYHSLCTKGIYVLRISMYLGSLSCRRTMVFVSEMMFVGYGIFIWLCLWAGLGCHL